jgi:glucose-6-phosphate isomerase
MPSTEPRWCYYLKTVSYRGSFVLPPPYEGEFDGVLSDWIEGEKVRRLWARDATLWTGGTEAQWLGWLGVVPEQLQEIARFVQLEQEIRRSRFTDAVLLGMGGSSLCPEVLARSFGPQSGYPRFHVLDSTDPAQVLAVERRVNLAKTLFIVASKSGSTLEPNIFFKYFYERAGRDGSKFFAITDPASQLEGVARQEKFARIFYGVPSIGGRFSALSNFGMVPAAIMGLDVQRLLESAQRMIDICQPWQDPRTNPGLLLGVFLGSLARVGRDKLTIICSPGIRDLGAWLEQLIAESTGKQGRGIIPVDREPLAPPAQYGKDRVFVYLRLDGAASPAQDSAVAALEARGFPLARISLQDTYQLGAEFFRWEMATAVAGAILGINPFDQPDVEASKIETRKLTRAFEETGVLPSEPPLFEERGLCVYGDTPERTLEGALRRHLSNIAQGDFMLGKFRPAGYVALLAYIEMTDQHEAMLNAIREHIRNRTQAATCLGFGPRFLHSTGQAYKGGPEGGVFLQITAEDAEDIPVPGQKFSFGVVKAAQAQGDLAVLRERGRRWMRIHLTKNVRSGLAELAAAVTRALQ